MPNFWQATAVVVLILACRRSDGVRLRPARWSCVTVRGGKASGCKAMTSVQCTTLQTHASRPTPGVCFPAKMRKPRDMVQSQQRSRRTRAILPDQEPRAYKSRYSSHGTTSFTTCLSVAGHGPQQAHRPGGQALALFSAGLYSMDWRHPVSEHA